MEEPPEPEPPKNAPTSLFKKPNQPMLVGKIGKLPKKLKTVVPPVVTESPVEEAETNVPQVSETPESKATRPYEPPPWSAVPDASQDYILEVLKSGAIIETIHLTGRPFWVFGRLGNCDVCMQHPTISRYHAVLQYRNDEVDRGFYIYDLESTHGTFLNKNRLKPRSYVRIKVGHMLKLGCSTRSYILNGPSEDAEEESALTVTELKQKRDEELRRRDEDIRMAEEKKKREEDRGVDWGLGEDADEETDLSENPYAQTNNEELYLDNPKKALRGFFEREGLELEYDCNEQGLGQFLCKVELPIDDEMGRPIFAEVFHKGKKKEAVIQCALEACRILDRHGVLRQATHESKKRKPKNWEENDYYDSDDDTFLDRTGTVEKKREMRMHAKVPQKAETYESLMEKEKNLNTSIQKLQIEVADAQNKLAAGEDAGASEPADSLDSFMLELNQSKPSKKSVSKLKAELFRLKQDHAGLIKLINLAKPAALPPLVPQYSQSTKDVDKKTLPMFGKRKKVKLERPTKSVEVEATISRVDDEEEEEEEEVVAKETIERIPSPVVEPKPEEGKKNEVAPERNRRKNQRRIQQKQEKAEIQKQKGYEEDANKEDYNMWVPPSGQTGDGRTSLNEKYGY